jgi:hypothetical protein
MDDDRREQLCAAVAARHEIRFSYGHDRKTIAPYLVYESEDGELFVAGPTQPFGKWHDYFVAAITKLERTGERFEPDPHVAPGAQYHKVICSI